MNVEMTVNGKKVTADTPPSLLLSDFLRENLNLTGTHVGCDTSQCGACVVHIDGVSMKSCTLLAVTFAKQTPNPTEGDVRHWLEGNICRCTGYQNIVAAVLAGAAAMQVQAGG